MIPHSILLIVIYILSGFVHQILYFIAPALAIIYICKNNFYLSITPVIKIYFNVVLFFIFLFLCHIIINGRIDLFFLNGVFRFISYFLFTVFLSYIDFEKIRESLYGLVYFLIFLLPASLYQVLKEDRLVLMFHHPNNLAYILVLLLFFIIVDNHKYKFILLFGISLTLLLTKSVGGLVCLTMLLIYYIISSKSISPGYRYFSFFCFLTFILAFIFISPERIFEQVKFISIIDLDLINSRAANHNFGNYGSGVWRITYWMAILNEYLQSNISIKLLGLGIDTMTLGNYAFPFMNKDPHNDYVKLLLETGLIGIVFFMSYLLNIFKLSGNKFMFLLIVLVPMFFGNIIVNFPFNFLLIALLTYFNKIKEASKNAGLEDTYTRNKYSEE